MRHKVSGRRLGRDTAHRKALIKNQIADLFCNGQIVTTLAKAKMMRPPAEKLITIAKRGLVNGGYTRIIKLGKRPGDYADMAILMLVSDDEDES